MYGNNMRERFEFLTRTSSSIKAKYFKMLKIKNL